MTKKTGTIEKKAGGMQVVQRWVMPPRELLYRFIKEHYVHDRFEGRGQHYAELIIDGYMNDLSSDNVCTISPFENRLGRFIQFDHDLNIITNDIPLESARNFGHISHLLGQ